MHRDVVLVTLSWVIRKFVEQKLDARSIDLFTSSLYHKTDRHNFRKGFSNCRINYTLLFGWQEDVRCRAAASAVAAPAA